jgi:hypothetical protein
MLVTEFFVTYIFWSCVTFGFSNSDSSTLCHFRTTKVSTFQIRSSLRASI